MQEKQQTFLRDDGQQFLRKSTIAGGGTTVMNKERASILSLDPSL